MRRRFVVVTPGCAAPPAEYPARSRRLAIGLAPLLAALVASDLIASGEGSIRGRVVIRPEPPPVARRPTVSDLGAPGPRDVPDRRRSVVYLEAAPQKAFGETTPRRAAMDQKNETFVPHVLAIAAGTVVDFPNSDQTYHNVFSLSRTKSFDLGRYAAGGSKAVRFDRPGIVRVFCDIHSHMSAFILVFSHRFFAVTDPDGRYQIPEVPAGSYTVTAWNEALPSESRQVRIPEAGGDVEVNFVLGQR